MTQTFLGKRLRRLDPVLEEWRMGGERWKNSDVECTECLDGWTARTTSNALPHCSARGSSPEAALRSLEHTVERAWRKLGKRLGYTITP